MSAQRTTQVEIDQILADALEYGQIGDFQNALELAQQAFAMAADGAHEDAFCDAGIQCAMALGWLGRSEEAIEYVQRILQRVVKRGDQVREARARAVYANVLIEMGLDSECYEEASRAASMATEPEQTDVLLKAMDLQAITLIFGDKFEAAAAMLDEAIMIADRFNLPRVTATLVLHLGLLNTRIGEIMLEQGDTAGHKAKLKKGLEQTRESIELAHASGNKRVELVGSANLAEFMADFGRFEEADRWIEHWYSLSDIATPGNWVHLYYTVCDLEQKRGNIEAALEAGQKAIETAKNISSADNYANAMRRLCNAYEAAGDFKSALAMHKTFHNEYRRRTAEKGHWQGKVDELNREMERVKSLLQDASSDMERLKEEAMTDPLTGLSNRRAFDQHMDMLSNRQNAKYAIAVLDLDHFKAVNDAFSHVLGDEVLRNVAKCLINGCRGTDLICRIGGEEFALILKSSTPTQIYNVCERLRAAVEQFDWADLAQGLEMTASIGVAHAEPGLSPAEVFAKADNRLFYAKAKGRNRVVTSISALERDVHELKVVG
ncbi:tetratricopeptide repeat-containing diguanylate cyclase [Maritalea myrionectae]|mgnify:CR=1 FL=1|uniref:diguanylate cyclase n=1 Tax=Maritalea myrionectae TaxID=454601 RepID=A0A2R4MDZ5_9HYPH|nr:diguanylate cyclase [Maritalea myrionectae]AVX04261.1 protein AdrA [Maritalea myrionectae]